MLFYSTLYIIKKLNIHFFSLINELLLTQMMKIHLSDKLYNNKK